MRLLRFIALFSALASAPSLQLRAAEINVFAAASLSDALEEIACDYTCEKASAGDALFFNFGASGTLARQIREGAPADIFVSADEAQMDTLAGRDLLAPGARRILLLNTLVVVVPSKSPAAPFIASAQDLLAPAVRRLAIGEPGVVPAGVYARLWLTRLALWDKLDATGKIIPCENVRAALAAVESGNADAAIVYATDARTTAKVRVALNVSGPAAPEITCPAAILKNARDAVAARRFFDYLATPAAAAVFEKHGFAVKE